MNFKHVDACALQQKDRLSDGFALFLLHYVLFCYENIKRMVCTSRKTQFQLIEWKTHSCRTRFSGWWWCEVLATHPEIVVHCTTEGNFRALKYNVHRYSVFYSFERSQTDIQIIINMYFFSLLLLLLLCAAAATAALVALKCITQHILRHKIFERKRFIKDDGFGLLFDSWKLQSKRTFTWSFVR